MPTVTFKSKLSSGTTLLGTFQQIPAADVTEIIGRAGIDFVIIDTEHGMFGVDAVVNLVRGCDAAGIASVIRVPNFSPERITQALDFGASSVMVPMIQDRESAEIAVSGAKYHPLGSRGICPFVRGASYYALDNPDYYKEANAETAIILQIEGTEGIANLDEILAVPNIDAIFIGPFDLSQSLGIPGQVTDARVIDALEDIIKRAAQKGIAVGNFAVTLEQAENYIQHGIRFLSYSTDTAMLTTAYLDLRKSIKTDLSQPADVG